MVVIVAVVALVVVTIVLLAWRMAASPTSPKDIHDDDRTTTRPSNPASAIPYFTPCPNPQCVRCQTYGQVQELAQRRLQRLRIHETDDPAQRVIEAVQQGPHQYYCHEDSENDETETVVTTTNTDKKEALRKRDMVSPCKGQYPTVLLVPGLPVQPMATAWHATVCSAFQAKASELWLEYQRAHTAIVEEPHNHNHHNSTTSTTIGLQYLDNDVPEGGQWQALHLLNQGIWQQPHSVLQRHFSSLLDLVEHYADQILSPGVVFGNIFFSVLTAGTVIEPHCGPTNIRHRLHVTLQPAGGMDDCTEKKKNVSPTTTTKAVARPTLHLHNCPSQQPWQSRGQTFVMDDSLVHGVDYLFGDNNDDDKNNIDKNYDATPRVVLIVDLWHPHLTAAERQLLVELYQNKQNNKKEKQKSPLDGSINTDINNSEEDVTEITTDDAY